MEENKVIRPYGEYEDSYKLNEKELGQLTEGLRETVSEESKLMQDINNNGVEIDVKPGVHSAITSVTLDQETGMITEYNVVEHKNTDPSLSKFIEEDTDKLINESEINEESKEKIKNMFDIKEVKDVEQILSAIKKYRNGEKENYFDLLPMDFKRLASGMASSAGISKKEAAEDIIKLASQDIGFDQISYDFNQMVKKELELPNMTEMYGEYLKERIEVQLANKAEELENNGKTKAAQQMRNVVMSFTDSYTLRRLFNFADENKTFVRKLKKEIKRYERWVTDFNYKYKESKFTIFDLSLIINPILRRMEDKISIDEMKKILVLIAKSVQNYDANNPVDHSYMYYLVYNFVSVDHVSPGKSEMIESFLENILNLAQKIKDIEQEGVEKNGKR